MEMAERFAHEWEKKKITLDIHDFQIAEHDKIYVDR